MGSDRRDELHPFEVIAAAMLVAVLVAALVLEAVAGLAGALFGDGWVSLPLADMPGVLGGLREHLGDPRGAWPPGVRTRLPGATGFYAALALVLAVTAAVAVLVGTRVLGHLARSGNAARWARPRDLRALTVHTAARGRVTLGRHRGRLLAAEERQSVIVVAPTQTGKTTGLAVPALLEWTGPILATSVKNDLLRDTLARRRQLGEIKVFDPTATTGLARASWTPLTACGDWEGARRTADRLAKAAQFSARTLQDADFWAHAGARFLAPLLLAAAVSDAAMTDVVRWVDTEEQAEVADALGADEHEAARNALLTVWTADDRLRSSLYMTASLALDAYNDPTVAACSAGADVTAPWLLDDGANTLYLCAPADEQSRLRPLFVTLIREIVGEVYARAARTGWPIEPALLVVLDEAPNIAPLPDLDQLASTGAGQGVQLVTVVQDLGQVHARWGASADSIVNNHRAKLFGPGLSCARTLDYVARVLGDQELRQVSSTSGERGRHSRTESRTFRALAPANLLRESRPGSMLLVYGHLPPARIELRPWFRDRRLARLAAPASGRERNRAAIVTGPMIDAEDRPGTAPAASGDPPQLQGDEASLFARFHQRLLRATAVKVHTSADNVDEACAFAWSQLLTHQPRRDSVFAWLRLVARREAIRLDSASRATLSLDDADATGAPRAQPPAAAHRSAETTHGLVEVRDRLAVLPEAQREIAFMRAAGWRYREIAECLGITEARVNKLLVRADARMRELDQRDIAPRSARAARLRALEDDSPPYILSAIGRPPPTGPARGGEQLRLEWRRLALAIDDYRAAHRITDPYEALGTDLQDTTTGPERRTLERRILSFSQARHRGVQRTPMTTTDHSRSRNTP